LNDEIPRLHDEIDRLKLAYNAAVDETQALKIQLEERSLVTANNPSITAVSIIIYYRLIACFG